MIPVLYQGLRLDLENPIFTHLINCLSDQDRAAFVERFGDLPEPTDAFQDAVKRTAELLLEPSLGSAAVKAAFQLEAANQFLLNGVSITPRLVARGGAARFILEAPDLAAFMALELATAVEVGAASKRCEHCNRFFLHGPQTGRRSHARYCADRCRVAAMRARNSSKGRKE